MSQESLILSKGNLSTVSFGIGLPMGAANEDLSGLSQVLISHLLRNTENKEEQDLALILDRNGIVPFSNVGKTSSFLGMNCPPQNVDIALKIFEEIIFQPQFREETISKIIQQQKGGLQQLEQIAQARLFQRTRWESAFGNSKITRNPNGTIADLENVSIEAVERRYNEMKEYQAKFLAIGVDISESQFSDTLGRLQEFGSKQLGVVLDETKVPMLNTQVDKMTQKTGNSYIGINMLSHGNMESKYEDVILNNVLSGGFSSRMFMEIRDKRNLSYGAFSLNSKQKDFGLFTAAMDVTPDRTPEAIKVALEVVKGCLTEKIPEEELGRAMKSALKTALFVSDSSQNYAQFLLGRMMANLETDLDKINEKIRQAAEMDWQESMLKHFKRENLTLGIAGEPGQAEEKWQEIVEEIL